jgi:CBS domain containing-hemolysin-like protein
MDIGHSRVPLYDGDESNIVGYMLAKSLIVLNPKNLTPASSLELVCQGNGIWALILGMGAA